MKWFLIDMITKLAVKSDMKRNPVVLVVDANMKAIPRMSR